MTVEKQGGINILDSKMTPSEMGKKGAKARLKKLTPERRKEIAQKAAKARWKNQKKKAKKK